MFTVDEVCEKLRADGKKITPQRRLIYRALEGKTNHPTAEKIYDEVRAIIPDISLATVYKTLRELVESQYLLELKIDGESSRFDPRTDQHSHLKCIGTEMNAKGEVVPCLKLEDISVTFPQLQVPENDRRGYLITSNKVVFFGYCPNCQARMKN